MLRIYDKVLELKTSSHKQEVFAESWGFFIYNQHPVTRVEFQLRRDVLRDFETRIETINDLTNALQSLWNYCSESWAKFCSSKVNRNHNQSKALTDHFWTKVCNINWNSPLHIHRKKPTQNKSLDLIRTNMRGMAMSASAFNNPSPDDLPSIIRITQKYIEQDLTLFFETDQHAFEERMQTKKNQIFVNI